MSLRVISSIFIALQEQENIVVASTIPAPPKEGTRPITLASYRKKKQEERNVDIGGTANISAAFLRDILVWNAMWMKEHGKWGIMIRLL